MFKEKVKVKKKITQGKKIQLKEKLVKIEKGRAVGPYTNYFDVIKGKAVRKILVAMAINPEVQGENKVKILHPVTTSPVWVEGGIFELVKEK